MVGYPSIKVSNAGIRSSIGASPTALFVGSTEGIGYMTMRAFVANTESPSVYFVGRTQEKGDRIIGEMKQINDKARYEFIAADFTLLQEVDRVAELIFRKTSQKGLDFVCLTAGYLSLGRHETTEGLDALLVIRYYARALLLHRLFEGLPASKRPKHVLSVLAATTEDVVNESDLSLNDPANYGKLLPAAAHSATFTSLAFEFLAKKYPDTTFVHSYPGLVKTNALTNWMSPWIKLFVDWVVVPLLTPFTVGLEEAGERQLFYLTSKRYPSLSGRTDRVALPEGVQKAEGEGAYLVSRYGETGEGKCMKGYRQRDFGRTVWEHTLQVFEDVQKKGN